MPDIVKYVDLAGKNTPVYDNGTCYPYLCHYRLLLVTKYGSSWVTMNMYAHHANPMHKQNIKDLKQLFNMIGLKEQTVKLIRPA